MKIFRLINRVCAANAIRSINADAEIPAALPVDDPVAKDYLPLFQGIGHMSDHQYSIRLKEGAVPHAVSTPRRVPFALLPKVKSKLQRMVELGMIEEVTAPTAWVSPMVPVPKKDGIVGICVDLTELNKTVKREQFQLPTAEEMFAKMQGAKVFSTLDAASGFWQIPLSPDCSELTTFITPFGRYRFNGLPFGITSGPEVFHRVMHTVLDGLEGVDCFIDDIVVYGTTQEEHHRRLRDVLDRCQESGFRLKPAKCQFRSTEVTFFGHVLTSTGLMPDEAKITAIAAMSRPQDREDLRRFMGMVA